MLVSFSSALLSRVLGRSNKRLIASRESYDFMFGVTPISAGLVECLSRACSSTQAEFQQKLAQVALHQDVASSVTDGALAPQAVELQRAVAPANPVGDRILQNLSVLHQGKPFPSGAIPSMIGGEPIPAKSLQLGPAAQPVMRSHEMQVHSIGKPEGVDNFEVMLSNLRDVYNSVIQVSLISKSAGTVSSSLNKLLSSG